VTLHMRLLVALQVIFLAFGNNAQAKTIRVPAKEPTIQAGINAAEDGDVVIVAPGTYFENIDFLGKAITVKSSSGPKVTIIDGGHLNSVVTFDTNEGPDSVLHGFTIQNGEATYTSSYQGGGIRVNSASPTITGNVITNNLTVASGGGIQLSFSNSLVQGNTISNNSEAPGYSGGDGGGLEVGGVGSAQIIGNVIENNTMDSGNGGGISLFAAGTPTLMNNIIAGNVAKGLSNGSQGGGIYIVNDSDALIAQNLLYNNNAGQGAEIYFGVPYESRGPLLVNNTIVGTATSTLGSAVYADGYYDQVYFYNNLMIGASGTTALYCDNTYDAIPPTLLNNDGYSATGTGFGGACSTQSGNGGNISADPKFSSKTTFRLTAKSPAVNSGDNSAPDIPAEDLAGKPRIVNGTVDMGAYEFQ